MSEGLRRRLEALEWSMMVERELDEAEDRVESGFHSRSSKAAA